MVSCPGVIFPLSIYLSIYISIVSDLAKFFCMSKRFVTLSGSLAVAGSKHELAVGYNIYLPVSDAYVKCVCSYFTSCMNRREDRCLCIFIICSSGNQSRLYTLLLGIMGLHHII